MPGPNDPPVLGLFDPSDLARQVAAKRRGEGLTLRQVAELTGVSMPTLSRVERGGHVPDRENLLKLARWVGLRLDPATSGQRHGPAVHAPNAGTVEAVELHLRADRALSGDDAQALTDLFRIAYERLKARDGTPGR
jgi:transcriptional regulator with XRE-family HTH domain